jgi:hypothetical protein
MDASLLRSVGITVGAAALAGALAVSQFAQAPAPERIAPATTLVAPPAPSGTTARASPSSEQPVFEPANAETAPPSTSPLSFLVRFEGSGPLGQAQALAERGREAEARRTAEAALARQSAFRGLCFDRFTLGGVEMVLRSCAPVSAGEHARLSADWLARMRALSAVVYAEPNVSVDPAQQR